MIEYKTKMCKDIAKELGIRPDDVRYAYDLIFEHLKVLIASGEKVVVKHFGTFEKTEKGNVSFKKSANWYL